MPNGAARGEPRRCGPSPRSLRDCAWSPCGGADIGEIQSDARTARRTLSCSATLPPRQIGGGDGSLLGGLRPSLARREERFRSETAKNQPVRGLRTVPRNESPLLPSTGRVGPRERPPRPVGRNRALKTIPRTGTVSRHGTSLAGRTRLAAIRFLGLGDGRYNREIGRGWFALRAFPISPLSLWERATVRGVVWKSPSILRVFLCPHPRPLSQWERGGVLG